MIGRSRAALCLLLIAACVPAVPCVARAADDAADVKDDPVAEARRLRDEAKPFFRRAGDTDLSAKERKSSRREAYTRLKEALRLLDELLDAHPERAASLDALYVEIRTMYYWVKKEAGIGEFGPERPAPPPDTGSEPAKEPPPAPSDGPSPSSSGGPSPSSSGGPVEVPADEPEVPAGPSAADVLKDIRRYETKHPGDVPGLHERYTAFLRSFPDRDAPEYATAVERLEELDRRLKDVYRNLRDDDPDAVEADEADVEHLIAELEKDLENPEEPVRARAARYLGSLGSGKAATPLVRALKDASHGSEQYEACAEALAKIGGRRVTHRLLREKPDSVHGVAVLDVLRRTVRRGGVNARLAGEALGTYVLAFNAATQHAVAEELFEAGKPGAVGLALVVDLAPTEKKVPYIEHLGTVAEPRAVEHLAKFLVVNPVGARKKMHRAARKAIEDIGKPGVRYLIRALENEDLRVWSGELLRQITGAKLKDDKPRTWEKWFRKNRDDFS